LAIFHFHMATVSRATGRSAVAAAAYRAGVSLINDRDGLTHNYQSRRGFVHAEIVLPAGVDAGWPRDRPVLWNAAKRAEKRSDGRVAREVENDAARSSIQVAKDALVVAGHDIA
jgi:dihydropteroate synthase